MANNDNFNRVNKNAQSGYGSSQKLYGATIPGLAGNVDNANEWDSGLRSTIANMYMNAGSSRPKNQEGWNTLPGSTLPSNAGAELYRMGMGGDIPFSQNSVDMWENWRDSGGVDANMQSNLRRAATNVIPGMFTGLKNNMERMRSVQGGYNPGYNSQTALMNRDATREATRASEAAEGQIAGMKHQGKQFGTQGLENFFARYGDTYQKNKMFGLSSMLDNDKWERENMMRMTEGEDDRDFQRAGGLLGLYGTGPAATNSAYSNWFQGLGGRDNSAMGYLSLLAGMNPKQSTFGNIMKGVGAGAGLLSGFGALR